MLTVFGATVVAVELTNGRADTPAVAPEPATDPPPPTAATLEPEPPAPEQTSAELVTRTDLNYEGSFRVPYGDSSNESSLSWGGAGLGYNPSNDSLFITCLLYTSPSPRDS